MARSLKAVRPDVLIVLLCCDPIDRLPPYVDACICTSLPLANLSSGSKSLLAEKQVNSFENLAMGWICSQIRGQVPGPDVAKRRQASDI